jgi:hypothetical protein
VQARTRFVVWGSGGLGANCALSEQPTLDGGGAVTVGVQRRVPFTACDSDQLPVDHQLPTQGDPRRPSVSLLAAGRDVPASVPIEYASDGMYAALLTVPTHGTFHVTVHLDDHDGLLAGDAVCPSSGANRRVPLPSGRCGCGAGFHQLTEAEDCEPCAPSKSSGDGALGNDGCDICDEGFYRPSALSSSSLCEPCLDVATCPLNATILSLDLLRGRWRHSPATTDVHICKSSGDWSPCRGGNDAGVEGDGYCAKDYRGPRCELCDGQAYSKFFDKLDARCHDCGDMTARTVVLLSVMLLLILLATISGSSATAGRLKGSFDACRVPLRLIRYVQTIWQGAGMRCKVKTLMGFYQCLAAAPSVYNVQPPLGLEHLNRWIHLLELPSEFERIFFVPTACLGDYRTRIWVGSTWPLLIILACTVCLIGTEVVRRCSRADDRTVAAHIRAALASGLQRAVPPTLGLTFLVLPSTSTRIFRAFLCETFEFDEGTSRRYLYADLTLSCDSDEYEATQTLAFAMLALWPVGIPLLYAALLWASEPRHNPPRSNHAAEPRHTIPVG